MANRSNVPYKMGPITFGGKRHTLEETAQMMGISKNGVRAIELRALAKIRKGLEKFGIKSLDDVLDLSSSRRRATGIGHTED